MKKILGLVALVVVVSLVGVAIQQMCWNDIIAAKFGGPRLSFSEMLETNVIVGMLGFLIFGTIGRRQ